MYLALSEFNLIAQNGRIIEPGVNMVSMGSFIKPLKPGLGCFLAASVLFLKGSRIEAKQPLMCLCAVTRGSNRAETVNK